MEIASFRRRQWTWVKVITWRREKKMRKYIIFRAEKGELEKYRWLTETKVGESFYRVANAGVKSLIWTIAEHYDSSGKPSPAPGYGLTESVVVPSAIDPSMMPAAAQPVGV